MVNNRDTFTTKPEDFDWRNLPIKKTILGVTTAIGLVWAYSQIYTVQPYERVVVTTGGHFSQVSEPGMHLTWPFVSKTSWYNVSAQQFATDKLNTYTVDNQEVDAILVVQYTILDKDVQYIFEHIPGMSEATDMKNRAPLLQNMVVDRWKKVAGKVNVAEIANNRGRLVQELSTVVKQDAYELYHVTVNDVQLYNLDYQESYRLAQAKAATVKTEIEYSQGQQAKERIEADTAKIKAAGIANQAIEQARGQAETTRLNAIAQAESIRVQGEAQAQAQELMAKALTANPVLVDLKRAERWNGVLPQNMYAGTPIPFLNTTK